MKKRALTLLELMLTIIVAGILASFALPRYQNFIEEQKAKVCETNLKTLQQALDIYAIDHDTMPASLSELPDEAINKAFAGILREKGSWRIKLAYFIVDLNRDNLLYAAVASPFVKELGRNDQKALVCPKDTEVLMHGGISYGVNSKLAKLRKRDYKKVSDTAVLIGDCDMPVFSDLSELKDRHSYHRNAFDKQNYALVITRKGTHLATGGLLSPLISSLSSPQIKAALLSASLDLTKESGTGEDGSLFALVEEVEEPKGPPAGTTAGTESATGASAAGEETGSAATGGYGTEGEAGASAASYGQAGNVTVTETGTAATGTAATGEEAADAAKKQGVSYGGGGQAGNLTTPEKTSAPPAYIPGEERGGATAPVTTQETKKKRSVTVSGEGEEECWCKDKEGHFYQSSCPCPKEPE